MTGVSLCIWWEVGRLCWGVAWRDVEDDSEDGDELDEVSEVWDRVVDGWDGAWDQLAAGLGGVWGQPEAGRGGVWGQLVAGWGTCGKELELAGWLLGKLFGSWGEVWSPQVVWGVPAEGLVIGDFVVGIWGPKEEGCPWLVGTAERKSSWAAGKEEDIVKNGEFWLFSCTTSKGSLVFVW